MGAYWAHWALALLVQHLLHDLLRVGQLLAMAKRAAGGEQKA
jgi:hypothetical protein